MYCILVIFNKNVNESISYRFVNAHSNISLIVVDNSTNDFHNAEIVINDGNTYISMHGNSGLSKAYNTVIENIKEKEGYVILLDDDTILNETYLKEIQNIHCDIALPIVKNGNSILSPCEFKKHYAQRWDGKDAISTITGINSGMVLNLKLFQNYRYDEHLFLDYVDHQFMMDMQDKNIQILNSKIQQSFSNDEFDITKAKRRFQLFKKDSRYFYRHEILLYLYVVNKHRYRLIQKYKRWF